jgi:hypothetical protein
MFVQLMSASDANAPAEEAPNDTDFRVVSTAGFAVPAAPGSPVWSFTNGTATENAVALPNAFIHALPKYALIPCAISLQPFQ